MSEKEKKHPMFPQYQGQRMPPMTEKDIQKSAYRQRREREQKAYLIAQETLRDIQRINEELQSQNLQDVQKSAVNDFHQHNVNELVKRILRGRK